MSVSNIDLILRIKNGYMASQAVVVAPFSRLNYQILKLLKEEKYIKEFEQKEDGKKKSLSVELLYDGGSPAVSGVKIVSKPGRRMYMRFSHLKPFLGGLGLTVLTTPKGILTDQQARAAKIGGEVLFNIW